MKRTIFLFSFLFSATLMASESSTTQSLLPKAQVECEKGRYKSCLKKMGKILEKDPGVKEAYYWRGRAYEGLKNPMEAANEYHAAILVDPTYDDAKTALDHVLQKISVSK